VKKVKAVTTGWRTTLQGAGAANVHSEESECERENKFN